MNNAIFYSWQSDLPNSGNRSFIEECLKDVIKNVKQIGDFSIELTIDRDTKNEPGSPDIVDAIFKKIDKARVFVADISIINSGSKFRKTPNPNVLVELGYAAKSLGWERVICLYNTDFGNFNDLPFDLKQRRPIAYSLKNIDKANAKKHIVKAITDTVKILYQSGVLYDDINDYLKVQVDTEILSIINHLNKICYGYGEPFSLTSVGRLLNVKDSELLAIFEKKEFIGFQIFKRWHVNEKNLQEIVNTVLTYPRHGQEIAAIVIKFIKWVGYFNSFNTQRKTPDLFIPTGRKNDKYYAVSGQEINDRNKDLNDRYILLRKINSKHGKVTDFGDFIEVDSISALISEFKLNQVYLKAYCEQFRNFISITERWLDATNGEFIVDNVKNFEFTPTNNS